MNKIFKRTFTFIWLAAVLFASCEEYTLPKDGDWTNDLLKSEENPENDDGSFVSIKFNIPSGECSITEGNKVWLEASVTGSIVRPENAVFSWNLDETELARGTKFLFEETSVGEYEVVFRVSAENETAEKTLTVKVLAKPLTNPDTLFYFDYGKWRNEDTPAVQTYTVPRGRKLVISPVRNFRQLTDTTGYEWALDGVIQRQNQVFPCYFTFTAEEDAGTEHTVTVYARDRNLYGKYEAAAETKIKIVESEGTYRRPATGTSNAVADRVYEFTPAPGQFIRSDGKGYPPIVIAPGRTEEEVTKEIDAYMHSDAVVPAFQGGGAVSLGTWGGYLVSGFDHSIENIPGAYSFSIEGNPLGDDWSEPGIVWVSQDENRDGIPNDTWFELRGSETGREGTIQLYSITYHKPDPAKGCEWVDNTGEKGALSYLSFYRVEIGYPHHTGGDWVTFTGTLLPPHVFVGFLWTSHPYPYGYVDNNEPYARFRISDAMQLDGTPANLSYIDFVKVQCAVFMQAGPLGEISTEMCLPVDYQMEPR
jgi:hypothetical protein